MIPIEKQVVNKKLSKILKELGVKQESIWKWRHYIETEFREESYQLMAEICCDSFDCHKCKFPNCSYFSAFTVAELMEGLPNGIVLRLMISGRDTASDRKNRSFHCELWLAGDDEKFECIEDTVANALAKARIWLIENKHIEI